MANFSTYKPTLGGFDYPTKINQALDELDARFNSAASFLGTLAVAGAVSLASTLSAGATTLASATVSGTLAAGATTLSSAGVTGALSAGTLSVGPVGSASTVLTVDAAATVAAAYARFSSSGTAKWGIGRGLPDGSDDLTIYDFVNNAVRVRYSAGGPAAFSRSAADVVTWRNAANITGYLYSDANGVQIGNAATAAGEGIYLKASDHTINFTVNGVGTPVGVFSTTGLTVPGTTTLGGAAGNVTLNIGTAHSTNSSFLMTILTSSNQYNWRIQTNTVFAGCLEFAPSTAPGGSSFNPPVLALSGTGASQFLGSVSATSFTASSYHASGTNPASQGAFRAPHDDGLWYRNIANNADLPAIRWDSSNIVTIGGTSNGNIQLSVASGQLVKAVVAGADVLSVGSSGLVVASSITSTTGHVIVTSGQISLGVFGTSGLQLVNDGTVGTVDAQPIKFRTSATERGRFTSGGFFKASNTANYTDSAALHQMSSNQADDVLQLISSHASSPFGLGIIYNVTAPNSAGSGFLECSDTVGYKHRLMSNGGYYNFSANNVNLSTRAVKFGIRVYTDDELRAYERMLEDVDFGIWKYRDQTHDDWNHGPTVEGLRAALVKHGLRDEEKSLIGDFAGGFSGLYTEDFKNIALASLVASNKRMRVELEEQKAWRSRAETALACNGITIH